VQQAQLLIHRHTLYKCVFQASVPRVKTIHRETSN